MSFDYRKLLRRLIVPSWLWALWLVFIIAGFGLLETVALINDTPGDTLSENVWALLKQGGWARALVTAGFFGFVGVVAWLGHHFFGKDA